MFQKKSFLITLLIIAIGIGLSTFHPKATKIARVLTYPYRLLKYEVKHNDPFTIPQIPEDTLQYYYGSRIQRTMSLLETSNEQHRKKVRILLYGQSIVRRIQPKEFIEQLRDKYPYAIIEFENRAIGGFSAPRLIKTAKHDLYPYYPDLLIFHVYGGEDSGELERIIANTRKYTTSEILLFNHHVRSYRHRQDESVLEGYTKLGDVSSDYWRHLAQKYGCELVDVRSEWKQYLNTHKDIEIQSLLKDRVHLNKRGNRLLTTLLLRHFRFNSISFDKANRGWFNEIKNYQIKQLVEENAEEIHIQGNFSTKNNEIMLDSAIVNFKFTGNKIELLLTPNDNSKNAKLSVLIDGKRPSKNHQLYYATRPSCAYKYYQPGLTHVTLGENPQQEKWTLTLNNINIETDYFDFVLSGSKTGIDGIGNNQTKFWSNSGRISISPKDLNLINITKHGKTDPPEGFVITWEVLPLHKDVLNTYSSDSIHILAQGLTNDEHTLTLIHDGLSSPFPLKALKVYSPPLKP